MNLRAARKRAGLTQQQLANLAGIGRGNLAAMESGNRTLTAKVGEELAPHVERSSVELVVENGLQRMRRASDDGDGAGVLQAAKSVVKAVSEADMDTATEAELDLFVDQAVKLAQGVSERQYKPSEYLAYDESRDMFGRVLPEGEVDELEDYGDDLGRDMFGRALLPKDAYRKSAFKRDEPEDDDDEDYEDDGRDAFGRRIAPL